VVDDGFDALERKHQIAVPDWVRKHMKRYVMSRAWDLLTDGKSLKAFRYDLSSTTSSDRTAANIDEFPQPGKVNDERWQEWKEELQDDMTKVLKSNGVKVKRFKPNDFYEYITAQKGGREFFIPVSSIGSARNIKELQGMLRKFDRVVKAYEAMEGHEDPFHSTVHGMVKEHFGGGAGSHMAYQVIANWIRKDGRRLWSSDAEK
jgi:hypothetical protein